MKSFFRRLLCILTAALTAAVLCAVPASAETAKLSKSSVNLPIGYAVTIKASGTSKALTWSSKDSEIASVKSSDGKSAKIVGNKTGSTYIYAEADGVSLKCKVTVRASFITADEDEIALKKGESEKITLTVTGSKKIAIRRSVKSVCSVSWGKWDGNKITLTVKALKNGSADIKVYEKEHADSAFKTIKVKAADGGKNVKEKDGDDSGSITEEVVALVNKEREAAGLSALKSDPTLNKIAALRAEEITRHFSHERPDGTSCFTAFEEQGIVNAWSAENIAAGSATADGVMQQWMGSSGHKANILGEDYTRIGVGMCEVSGGYGYYWVQVFTDDF